MTITDTTGRPIADSAHNTIAPRPHGPWDTNRDARRVDEPSPRTGPRPDYRLFSRNDLT